MTVAATLVTVLVAGAALVVSALRHGADGVRRARLSWLAAALAGTGALIVAGVALGVLVGWPRPHLAFAFAVVPLVAVAVVLGRRATLAELAERVLVASLVGAGLTAVVATIWVLAVVGLGPVPDDDGRATVALCLVAAGLSAAIAGPVRRALVDRAASSVMGDRRDADEALRTFGGRMSRAVPMDELLLQLAESLHRSLHLRAAEVWTGTDGRLERSVSVPHRGPAGLRLSSEEIGVVARSHAQGRAWLEVWMPDLLVDRDACRIRAVAVAHLGQLLGLIVVERAEDDTPFTDDEDRVLVDLARQVGLALHNVGLDSALQASLEELELRNRELIASRARVVAAADESRRRIERDLHDGAQQHLVALAVKVGLVKTLMTSDPDAAASFLDELRGDVQATLTELRNLAHGIYPPLLRDRGLGEALTNAANRAVLATDVEVTPEVDRYAPEVEAAVYFCCLEAMQNAGKHAGADAHVTVTVALSGPDALHFAVVDDGPGFDPAAGGAGHGFVNMADRIGAVGGTVEVTSAPGAGTTVAGTVPATPVSPRP